MSEQVITKVKVEKEGKVAIVTINRPEALNAMAGRNTPEGIAHWGGVFNDLKDDPDINVVVLTGAGRAFCVGADVKAWGAREAEYKRTGQRPRQGTVIGEGTRLSYLLLRDLQKPSIAMVNGPAVGSGADQALVCDMRIASDQAWFQWAYILRGLTPADGGCWLLPRVVGEAMAMELLLTGRRVYADEALQLGIVNKVVPHDQLKSATMELAEQIANGPRSAVQLTRNAIYMGATQSFLDNLELVNLSAGLERESIAKGMIAKGLEKKEAAFEGE